MPLFQPEKMVRVEIDFPDRLMMEVTKVISSLGYFQIEDMSMMDLRKKPSDDQKTTVIQTKLTNLETLLTALQAKLGLQSSRETEKGLELIEDPSIIEGEISSLSEQVENLGAKIEATRQAIESKKATLKLLLPFKDLPYDLGAIRNRRYLYSILGTMPTNRIERFRSSLSQIPYVLLEEPRANNRSQVLLLGPRNQRDFLILTARSAYLDPLEIDESEHGLLADMTSNLAVKVDELEKELKNLETERKQLSGSNAEKSPIGSVRFSTAARSMTSSANMDTSATAISWLDGSLQKGKRNFSICCTASIRISSKPWRIPARWKTN